MKNSKQSQDTLRRERPPFTMIENAIIEDERVSRQALLVYWVLCKHADNITGECWPGFTRIAKMARYSRPKVISAIEELVQLGYILKENRVKDGEPQIHLHNKYTILRQYDYQKVSQGSAETLPGVVKPLYHPSKATLPELYSETGHRKLEEGSSPSSSSNSPDKESSLYEKFTAIRKQRFRATDDLETQFPKHTEEFDALSTDEEDKLLTAYEKYINDFSDKWINDIGHTFAYFWKKRDKWYTAVDTRAEEEREREKLEKEYGELCREIAAIGQQELSFPGLSPDEQKALRAASPGRQLPWETGRRAKLIGHAEEIGRKINFLSVGGHICPRCGDDYQGKMCHCGFMEEAA